MCKLPKNIGKTERIIRIIIGSILLGIGHFTKNFWFALAAVPLITGIIGYCPAYSIFKKNKK